MLYSDTGLLRASEGVLDDGATHWAKFLLKINPDLSVNAIIEKLAQQGLGNDAAVLCPDADLDACLGIRIKGNKTGWRIFAHNAQNTVPLKKFLALD